MRTDPFPCVSADGRVIVDQLCKCGDRRTEHSDADLAGLGPCTECKCQGFDFDVPVSYIEA